MKVRSKDDTDAVIQTSTYDGLGRRMQKTVSNAGQLDKTEVYLYDSQRIIEIRDGSGNMVQQFIHGTQYIDELVMVRVAGKGELYIHQDANWNVIATTNMAGYVVERSILSPYGEVKIEQMTGHGDADGDGDVDGLDYLYPLFPTTCTDRACLVRDLDFDGDYDSTDYGLYSSLPHGVMRRAGLAATATDQPFAHQGLLYEPEVRQYQNRARQYDPAKRRFLERDRLGVMPDRLSGHGTPEFIYLLLGDTTKILQGRLETVRAKAIVALELFGEAGLFKSSYNELWSLASTGPQMYGYVPNRPIVALDLSGQETCFACQNSTSPGCSGGCQYCAGGVPPSTYCKACSDSGDPPAFGPCCNTGKKSCTCKFGDPLQCACKI